MNSQSPPAESCRWDEVEPFLDELVGKLRPSDRQAVLLRFYEQKNFAQVGATMGISEEAARKRVSRATNKLRGMLQSKGVGIPATGLAAVLLAEVTAPAPAALAGTISGMASTSVLAKGVIAMMTIKTKLTAAAGIALLLLLSGIAAITSMQMPAQNKTSGSPDTQPATPQPMGSEILARNLLASYRQAIESQTRIHYIFVSETTREGDWNWEGLDYVRWLDSGEFFRDGSRMKASNTSQAFRRLARANPPLRSRWMIVGPDGLDPDLILYSQDDGYSVGEPPYLSIQEPSNRWWVYSIAAPTALWGVVEGGPGREPIWETMSQASALAARAETEAINGHPTHLVHAATRYGQYRLWLDPQAGFLPRRVEISKIETDLYNEKPLAKRFPTVVPQGATLSVPNVAQKSWNLLVDQVEIGRFDDHFTVTKATIMERTDYVDGKMTSSRTEYARQDIDVNPDFAALGAFKVDAADGMRILPPGQERPEDPKFEWRAGQITQSERLYGRAVYQDGSPVYPLGWIARLEPDPEVYTSSTMHTREILEPDGLFSVSITSSERERLIRNFGGMIQIKDRSGIIGEVSILELGLDPKSPPGFIFHRK